MKKRINFKSKVVIRSLTLAFMCFCFTSKNMYSADSATILNENFIQTVVTGNVTSKSNKISLAGVTVYIEGTNIGVVTDFDGKYEIEVGNPDAVLVFSYIGFKTQKVLVNNQTSINVSLEDDMASLDEIVVVGYGTQRKQDVTGALSSIKSEDIVTEGANTVEKSLQGRVAGVQVESAGGNPGSGVRILIRGTGSIGNNSPLYIVDGVQVDNINNISPTSIASMDILKDASAAAIYGSRAANGVVIITTKSGRKGETIIEFNAYYGLQKISKKLDLLNASQWARVNNMARDNAGLDRLEIAQNPESLGKGTNWQEEIYQLAPMQNYDLSVSGGGDNYTFSLSGGYLNQDGIVKKTNYNRWNLRLKSDLTKGKLRIGESVIVTKEFWRNASGGFGGQGGNPVGSAAKMIPVFDVYNPEAIGGYGGAYGPIVNIENPVAVLNLEEPEVNIAKAIINVFAEYSILDELKYKLNLGYTNTAGYNYTYTYPYEVGTLFKNADSDLSESRNETSRSLLENTLAYKKSIGRHKIQALVGNSYQNTQYRELRGSKSGMPLGLKVLDAGTVNIASGSNAWESVLISYFGRLIYSYDDRYVLTGIIRRDGSSRFGKGNKFGNFPSIALAWNASNESFFEPLSSFINQAKLRASYGVLGNQEFDDYRYSPAINLNLNYVVGQDQHLWPGAIQTAFATPDIKWETSKTFNIGTDFSFFDYKLQLTADYFIKKNSDVILQVPIPLSTGASTNSPYINAGEITNKGFEASLSYGNTINDFTYGLMGTFSSVKNKVENLGSGSQQIFGGEPTHHGASATVTEAGLPVGAFFLIKTDGIFDSQEEIAAHSRNDQLIQPNALPGDIRFVDFNNDGQIDQNDRQNLGSPTPDFTFGFGGNLEWKSFDLNVFFQGTYGNKIYNGLRQDLEGMNYDVNYSVSTLNAWTPDNTNTNIPRAVLNDPNFNSQTSDRFLENGSYLRFKTLQLGYNFSESILESLNIAKFRLYLSADNLFTITDYKGYNPDLGRSGSILDRGVDFGEVAYPLARTFMGGIQLSF